MFDRKIVIAVIFCLGVIACGTTGYIFIEDYSFIDALYMSVITISTVGFGEIKPLSEIGRIFTTFLILIGIGALAFAGHAAVESLLEKVWTGNSEVKKMKKRIAQLKGHFIICGFGRVGESAVEHFSRAGADFLLIEFSPEQCQQIRERGYIFLEGDATRENVLLEAGIKSARGLLALLDSDPKNLFIVLTARELNPTLHIISRSTDKLNDNKILRAGADSVISPFVSAGKQVADDLLRAAGRGSSLSIEPDRGRAVSRWITVQPGSSMSGSSIEHVCREMGQEVVGMRRGDRDFLKPETGQILMDGDMLLVLDDPRNTENLPEIVAAVPRKLVIVDDNPVIVRLYSRLFQKAGFHPLTAGNGEQGLRLILDEKPDAAVIDYKLPGISGIDMCRKIRENQGFDQVKLILFTGDDEPQTRKMAFEAGADDVVLKSPDASEVIDAVVHLLQGDK